MIIGRRLLLWAAGAALVLTLAALSALAAAAGGAPSPLPGARGSSPGPAPLGSATPCPVPYTYTVSSGVIVTSTNLLPGSQCARCIVPLTLPFPVSLYGQTYTSTNVANYGVLQFTTADTSLESCPPPYAQLGPALMPYWDDDIDTGWNEPCQGSYGLPCGVFTSTTGVAPNRVFNIEWRGRPWGSNHETLNYETRLYENSTTIDFVYGFGFMFGYSAFIGVQDGGSQFTSYICNLVGSYQFLTVRWTRDGPPSCPSTETPSPTLTPQRSPTPTAPPSSTSTPAAPTATPTGALTPAPTASPARTVTPAPPTGTPAPGDTVTPSATSTGVASPTPGASRTPASTPASTATPCAIPFTDVSPADYYYAPVTYLYCRGVISGYSDQTFRPAGATTRGQMTKIVVLGFGIPIWTPAAPAPPTFRDVPRADPFFAYIETAAHTGIVSGYADGSFHPAANVARGQLAKMVVAAAGRVAGWPLLDPPAATFADVPRGSAFYPFVETAVCHGIVSGYGDGSFRPGATATRGQIAKIEYLAVLNGASCAGP
jgi:hypothetical protein